MNSFLPAIDLAVFQRLCEAHANQSFDPTSYAEAQRTLITLMGNLPGMAYCCRNNERWTMLFVSEGCRELTGYAPADLTGEGEIAYADLIHPDDRQKVWNEVQAALAAQTRFRLVYRLVTAAQNERWMWEQGHGIFSAEGELVAIEGFVTDITDRVQAEDALRAAELKYRSIFEQAVHGIYRSTPDGKFLAANPAMAAMLGYSSPAELIGNCTDIARDFYADAETRAALQHLLATQGKVQGFEAQVFCRDHSIIWMRENIHAVHDAAGALLYYEGSVEDITAGKRAEEKLARSEEQYRVLFESNPNPMWVYDAETYAYLAVNQAAVRHYGYTREEFLRMNIFDVRSPENIPAMLENIASLPSAHRYAGEWEHRKKDGTRISVEISSQLIDFGGRAARLVLINDVTERKHAEAALRESEERYRELFENANDVIYTTDLAGRYITVNRVVEKITGYACEEIRRMTFAEMIAPEHLELSRQMMARKLAGEETTTFYETEIVAKNGERRLLEVSSQLIYDEGAPVGVQGIARDITTRKRAERALRESEERYRELFENANDLVYTHDLAGNFTSLNKTGERITGYTREEAAALNIAQIIVPEHLALARRMMERKASVDEATVYEVDIIAKDGRRVPLEVSTRLVYRNGQPVGVQGIARDIAERKHTEAKLLHNAYHDALTGLPNRNLFTDHLQMAVERARRHDEFVFAVLFLDLDRFKNVNDSLGHTVGDQLLVALSRRLQHCLRPSDVVARLGGDEFAILLNDIGAQPGEAVALAERVRQELMQPFNLGGHEVFTTVSIGIALSTTGYETPEAVLRDADTVMYRAKAQGKARHEVFDQNMHARVVALLRLENDLRRAVERDEFRLQYQPIVSLETGRVSGFEALARWQHPELGLIQPSDFIPVAEETGVIVELGQWVMEEACRQMRAWQLISPQHSRLKLSVNLSSRHFVQPDLYERIVEVLKDTGLAPAALQLEITESVLMENAHTIVPLLSRLRDLGVELAIDDFGTGYSSLSYLSRLKPIHTLKIDRSFISMGGDDHENSEIVRTIIMLAKNMGKEVVAEGIETAEQLARLRRLNCDYGQGYLFSRPQDPSEIERRLRQQHGLHALNASPLGDELSVA
ncbi:MAG TPA: PAS domain S-box protein [Pyrinomonadaceae bacterium]|jgi:diguanylate cyclase (GGDEF)-like protein/PAS domain S-box-containing protein